MPPRSNVTWPALKCISIRRMRVVHLGLVNMSAYKFFVSGPKFTFLLNAGVIVLVNAVYSLSIISSVPEIFALKSIVFLNHADFCTFFAFPNFIWAVPPKLVPNLSCLDKGNGTSRAKVSLGYSLNLQNYRRSLTIF